jgi:hypothetical protein
VRESDDLDRRFTRRDHREAGRFSDVERRFAELVIGNLDDKGYFREGENAFLSLEDRSQKYFPRGFRDRERDTRVARFVSDAAQSSGVTVRHDPKKSRLAHLPGSPSPCENSRD